MPSGNGRISFSVIIHEIQQRGQNSGQVSKASIRCVDADSNKEFARYDLSEDGSTETAKVFGAVYRSGSEWKFKAIGQGFSDGLAPLATSIGVSVG